MKTKRCTKCGEEKPISEFLSHRKNKDGLRSCCIKCRRDNRRELRKTEPDRRKRNGERVRIKSFIESVPNAECYLAKARKLLSGEVVDPHCEPGRRRGET